MLMVDLAQEVIRGGKQGVSLDAWRRMARRIPPIDGRRPLRDCPEMAVGLSLPLAVSRRLDLLLDRLDEDGARAYRKDLVGALILAAPESVTALDDLVRRYRRASARDARVGSDPASVLDPSRPRPGRRTRATERADR
jgi:hypothetical protein